MDARPTAVDALTTAFLFVFPFVFVALWLFIWTTFATRSGWVALARRFPGGPRPAGQRMDTDVLRVGPINEKYVTRLVPIQEGLYLDSAPVYRFRRPAVFVPWEQVRDDGEEGRLWRRGRVLDLGGVTSIRITLRAYETIAPYLAHRAASRRA